MATSSGSSTATGSLSSLREFNRLRIVDFLRINGTASRAELARRTGLSALHRLHAGGGPPAPRPRRRARRRVRRRGPARPPGRPARARPFGGRRRRRRLRPRQGPRGRLGPDAAACSPRARPPTTSTTTPRARSTSPPSSSSSVLEEADLERDRLLGTGIALAGPIDHDIGALHPSDVLPGWSGVDVGRGDREPAADARLRRQRRQPGRARRGHPRRRAQRPLRGLRLDLLGHRRRHHRRRPPLPRTPRHGRGDRPRRRRPAGTDLPLRQPRLPRDAGLRPGAAAPGPGQPRRGADGEADDRAGA